MGTTLDGINDTYSYITVVQILHSISWKRNVSNIMQHQCHISTFNNKSCVPDTIIVMKSSQYAVTIKLDNLE